MSTVACFDIGGSFIRYGRARENGIVAEAGRAPVPSDDWDAFVQVIRDGRHATGAERVSISITGSYDPDSGMAVVANLPCVDGRPFAKDLAEALGARVLVTNDADCFALAEAFHGAGQGHEVVFAIILGSGVGGGIVAGGKLLRGSGGVTGEWGHGPVFAHGPAGPDTPPLPCGCGLFGCLDVIGSARGIENIHAALHHDKLKSTDITKAWHDGAPDATATIARYLELVAPHLALIVNTVGPRIIPVGGGLSNDRKLITALDEATRARCNARFAAPLVVPGVHTKNGGLIGAGMAAKLAGWA